MRVAIFLMLLVAVIFAKQTLTTPKPVKSSAGASVKLQLHSKTHIVSQQCLENAVGLCSAKDPKNEQDFSRFTFATRQIKQIKEKASTWVPKHNKFSTASEERMKFQVGSPLPDAKTIAKLPVKTSATSRRKLHATLPDEFDARKKWPDCITPIPDQGKCGSCWAFSSSSVFNDRICIKTGKPGVHVSVQDAVSCSIKGTCDGGSPYYYFQYTNKTGIVTEACNSYKSANLGSGPNLQCPAACDDDKPLDAALRYRSTSATRFKTVEDIKNELMTNGPMTMNINVFADLMFYSKGIYKPVVTTEMGGHAVRLIGWGKEPQNGTEYWVIANSWGTSWGIDGILNMVMGVCGDMSLVVGAEFTDTTTGPAPTQTQTNGWTTVAPGNKPVGPVSPNDPASSTAAPANAASTVAPTGPAPAPLPTTQAAQTTRAPRVVSPWTTKPPPKTTPKAKPAKVKYSRK